MNNFAVVSGLLTDEVRQIPGAKGAVLVSADGLLAGASEGQDQASAERFAAAVTGLQALSRSLAPFCRASPSGWLENLITYEGGLIFLCAAGDSSFLALAADGAADVGNIGYRMTKLVERIGTALATPARTAPGHSG
ncbi:hypothetical protein GCM10010495_48520 [Kitasatospora herbaricolor]|uniref:roadblock/LC7 domain-containing protein n=1 Tax=Kitasatospora herbaricolor TaxID=68217 RepID=UPI001749BA6C|nr:roadblock/LC7 domain-containing protein [Kitasatospora herbaricolor]MDQ0305781.1 putative regulator of Ras-like GTPase activity (Roadblock/LC7/MglB family) [Kitasatospora herbaricolor]GGV26852.1 hypothetical protein GCM10010495_48520 [Kitasatospora herbaricolor]